MKLPEIPEFSKRNPRRSRKLLHDNQVVDLVNKYNERYLHWEELKHRKISFDPIIIWYYEKHRGY